MNKIWMLTKILLKMNYADMVTDKKKRVTSLFSLLGLLLVGFLFIAPLANGVYGVLKQVNQENVLLGMGLAIGSIWVFVFSITTILTVFYYSNDVEMLLPLPLKPAHIITAKFITVLITQYVMTSFILFPIFIVYGLQSGAFITYYVYFLIVYVFFPIIPLVLASLLMIIIMRYTNIAKNKDRNNMFMGLFTLLLVVGINIFIQWKNRSAASGRSAADFLTNNQSSFLFEMTSYFPTTYFGAIALTESTSWKGTLYLLLFAAISFAFYALFFYVAERTYLKGVIGISNSTAKKEVISSENFNKATVQNSHWKAYVKKEFRILTRTPQFFINCIVQTFVMPIMFFFIIFVQDGNLAWINKFINDSKTTGLALGLAFCAGMFLMGSNVIATTSFSREGRTWFINRYLPVKAEGIFFAKVFTAWLINTTILAIVGLVLIIVGGVSLVFILLWFLLSANGLWLNNLIGTRWDAQTADIHWDTEQKMFKSRYTTLWNFFVNILLVGITVGGVCALFFSLGVGMWGMFFSILVIFTIVNVIVSRSLQLGAERILANIK
ncbi:putative ABC transporter permease subunit [Bacillus cereus group sp. BfR-BA-01380]|uniref:putative ABC transporter permease subunit n=1 Tax=Bacillus cereus group sp. BfR-BA-01380 TaxID=2920324 RepID=UPI001F5AC275|nr:ABC transporter permease [Bacillus cereus group sp. BfR-BA-01380]